jgi:hypothetical protein
VTARTLSMATAACTAKISAAARVS